MGGAIVGGIRKAGLCSGEQIMVSDINETGLLALQEKYQIQTTMDNKKVTTFADILFLAVKPHFYATVIKQIREILPENTLVVSIAAGQTMEQIESMFGRDIKLVRTMPNTPALVMEGMSALSPNAMVTEDELLEVKTIFESLGRCQVVPESLMETVIGVSGSSPAYVYLFIEAMADAAVAGGMPRAQAYEFAAQSVLGAAKMVLDTKLHPGELKDMVCSPGGTTIAAVAKLEVLGFRGTVMEGVFACTKKANEMSRTK
ncbi:MAG: pyrroline-5-carboxylate reductase [Clostridiales bacterium]|nr:pyrroline-5-carboxylate reductase [Clostridiales bacterium]